MTGLINSLKMGCLFMYKNKCQLYFLVFLFFTFFTNANLLSSRVLIRAPQTSFTEFSAYADTESLKTYAQYQLDQIYKTPRPILLETLLEKSQREFLSHEPQRAKKTYKLIISHIHSFDWTLPERKIILYALFRIAQLETNLQKQKLFLQEAAVFSGDLKIDTSLFPPPLVQTYSNLKKSMNYIPVNLKKKFPGYELVLINGKKYSVIKQNTLLLAYGVYRIRALSSSKQTWFKTLSLSRLLSQKVQSLALIDKDSSCQQMVFNQGVQKPNHSVEVLFPNFCVWNSIKEQTNTLAGKNMKHSGTMELEKSNKVYSNSIETEILSENTLHNHIGKKKWVKPVLWTGGAVLFSTLVFFIIKNNQKFSSDHRNSEKDQGDSSTVTVGF